MNVKIKVRIETDKINVELTEEEARSLYNQLKEFFEQEKTVYVPYQIPLFPLEHIINPPLYINDSPPYKTGHIPNVVITCSSSKEGE